MVIDIDIFLLRIAYSYNLSNFYCVVCLFLLIYIRSLCSLLINSLSVECTTCNVSKFAACNLTLCLRCHFSTTVLNFVRLNILIFYDLASGLCVFFRKVFPTPRLLYSFISSPL